MKRFLLPFIFILPMKLLAQADIHFSQFYETSILRNPALTGVFPEDYRVGAYERSEAAAKAVCYNDGIAASFSHGRQ
jgi:hypothetical protein